MRFFFSCCSWRVLLLKVSTSDSLSLIVRWKSSLASKKNHKFIAVQPLMKSYWIIKSFSLWLFYLYRYIYFSKNTTLRFCIKDVWSWLLIFLSVLSIPFSLVFLQFISLYLSSFVAISWHFADNSAALTKTNLRQIVILNIPDTS